MVLLNSLTAVPLTLGLGRVAGAVGRRLRAAALLGPPLAPAARAPRSQARRLPVQRAILALPLA
jgi:hypothetical protein